MMRTTSSAEPGLDAPLGRYRLMALLGQGGMADVYLACTQGAGGFQKLLVVKLARFTGDPMFATMFLSEARLAAQLSHPNVVHTYEIGEEGTRHYIVMEYLDGGNLSRLRQKMVQHGGIPLRISLHILLQVLEGLEYAHEAEGLDGRLLKVVHRDLSPSNIMVTAQGVVKILDFGIAKAADSHSYTQTGRFSGKLEYMPPEQLRGASVDQRADIFSFGVMLAESFLGHKLWGNATGPQIAVELGQGKLPSLEQGDVDPGLRQICQRALAPDPENRYATAGELKADLAAYVATLGKPVSQRELADFVRKTLEDDRAKLQTVIDSQLQKLSFLAWGGETPPPDLPRLEHTPSGGPIPEETVIEDSGQVQIITKNPALPPLRKSPVKWLVVGGVAVAVLAIALFVAVSGSSSPKPQPAPETALSAPSPAPSPAPAPPPAPTSVRVEVVASPADATIMFDGKPVGGNPYVASFPRDLTGHELVISAPGYATLTQQVTLDRDLNFRLNLQREPVAAVVEPVPSAKLSSKRSLTRGRTIPPRTPGTAVVEPVVATPATTPPVDVKRSLDSNVLENQPTKRSLDSNVLDDKAQKKPTLDRENPWKN